MKDLMGHNVVNEIEESRSRLDWDVPDIAWDDAKSHADNARAILKRFEAYNGIMLIEQARADFIDIFHDYYFVLTKPETRAFYLTLLPEKKVHDLVALGYPADWVASTLNNGRG